MPGIVRSTLQILAWFSHNDTVSEGLTHLSGGETEARGNNLSFQKRTYIILRYHEKGCPETLSSFALLWNILSFLEWLQPVDSFDCGKTNQLHYVIGFGFF